MIVLEISLVSLGLVFVLTSRHRKATTFGLASLCFVASLIFGSLGLAAFGIAVMLFGIGEEWLTRSAARRSAAVSLIVMFVLSAIVMQHVDRNTGSAPTRGVDVPKTLFTNNTWSLPKSLERYHARPRLNEPTDRISLRPALAEVNSDRNEQLPNRLGRLEKLSSDLDLYRNELALKVDSSAFRDVLNTPINRESIDGLRRFVVQNGLNFQAKAGDIAVSGQLDCSPPADSSNVGQEVSLRASVDVHLMNASMLSQNDANRLN